MLVRDVGVTAERIGRLGEAVEHFRSARSRYEALGDKAGVAETLLDQARVRKTDGPDAQAQLVREALEVLKGMRHNETKLDAYDRLIRISFEQRQIEEALSAFADERKLLRRLDRST